MATRYASAHEEIHAILQREPRLTAKQVWHELTCWPVPSIRTIHRVAQGVKRELAIGADLAAVAPNSEARFARVEPADGFSKQEFQMPDRIDEVLAAVQGMCKGVMDRMDALEEQHKKERADAAEKAANEAAAAIAAAAAAKARADSVDRHAIAEAQQRFDSGYQAFGLQAPHALDAETLVNYRIRLATGLKRHSKTYKDSNLDLIGDEAARLIVENTIISDAVEASCCNPGKPNAPLIARTKIDPNTQHRVTKFYGDSAACWGEFSGGHTMFGTVNKDLANATRNRMNS